MLELGLKTCCGAGGACQVRPMEAPAARMLAELYLDAGSRPDRIDALLHQVLAAQGGEATWYDHYLFARYYKLIGRTERMEEARTRALASLPPARTRERALLEKLLDTHV